MTTSLYQYMYLSNPNVPTITASIDFDINERPFWREEYGPTTHTMIKDIMQLRKLCLENERAIEFTRDSFAKIMTLDYVVTSNRLEKAGIQTLEETEELLGKYLASWTTMDTRHTLNTEERETINTFKALKQLDEIKLENDGSSIEKLVLEEKLILDIHSTLMEGISEDVVPGEYRNKNAFTERSDESCYFYTDPRLIAGLIDGLYDIYNGLLLSLVDDNSGEFYEKVFKLAAWILFNFVDIHPFSDGNGRMCRLLANHVLSCITPFPVSIEHSNPNRSARDDYIEAIEECRRSAKHIPSSLTAMIIESVWIRWRSLFVNLD